MTLEEYNIELKKIQQDFERAKNTIAVKYGLGQAKFKKGDIIKDHKCIIMVDRIIVTGSLSGLPYPVYKGLSLRKDLTPRKDGSYECIYGNDGVELIKGAEL